MSAPIVVGSNFAGLNGPNVFSTTSAPSLSVKQWSNFDNNRTHWRTLHTASNTINWGNLDTAVANAKAAGITDGLYVLYGCPTFLAQAADNATAGPYGGQGEGSYPTDLAQLTYFCQQFAARNASTWGNFFRRVQLFNEPEGTSGPFTGTNRGAGNFYWGTAAQYVNMLWTAYSALKGGDATLEVLSPGCYDMTVFATWLDTQGTTGSATGKYGYECFDGVALHPYHAAPNGTYSARGDFATLPKGGVNAARALMVARGRQGLRFHATEFGFDSNGGSAIITAFLALTAAERKQRMARTIVSAVRNGFSTFLAWSFENAGNYCGQIGSDSTGVDAGFNEAAAAIAGKTITAGGYYFDGREWLQFSDGSSYTV